MKKQQHAQDHRTPFYYGSIPEVKAEGGERLREASCEDANRPFNAILFLPIFAFSDSIEICLISLPFFAETWLDLIDAASTGAAFLSASCSIDVWLVLKRRLTGKSKAPLSPFFAFALPQPPVPLPYARCQTSRARSPQHQDRSTQPSRKSRPSLAAAS